LGEQVAVGQLAAQDAVAQPAGHELGDALGPDGARGTVHGGQGWHAHPPTSRITRGRATAGTRDRPEPPDRQAPAPPSMRRTAPVVDPASGEARWSMAAATSSGVALRPISDACRARTRGSASSGTRIVSTMGVATAPGHTTLTRTSGASSTASARDSATTPPLDAE